MRSLKQHVITGPLRCKVLVTRFNAVHCLVWAGAWFAVMFLKRTSAQRFQIEMQTPIWKSRRGLRFQMNDITPGTELRQARLDGCNADISLVEGHRIVISERGGSW